MWTCLRRYYTRLTLDFDTNKRICDEISKIPSKKLRNKIAGFITHLMKRIQVLACAPISLEWNSVFATVHKVTKLHACGAKLSVATLCLRLGGRVSWVNEELK
jgi:ribosomal protein S17E